jgi:hypothetical protein
MGAASESMEVDPVRLRVQSGSSYASEASPKEDARLRTGDGESARRRGVRRDASITRRLRAQRANGHERRASTSRGAAASRRACSAAPPCGRHERATVLYLGFWIAFAISVGAVYQGLME